MTKIFNRRKFKSLRQKLKRESTPPEDLLWNEVRNKQLGYKFRRQHGVGNFIVDFYCSELKLAVEVDGAFHSEKSVLIRDRLRERYLESQGIIVRRYSASEIFESLEGVVMDLKEICDVISGEVRIDWG